MSFQQYMRAMVTHFLTRVNQPADKKIKKKGKPNGLFHHWFGLIPFSIKLFTSK